MKEWLQAREQRDAATTGESEEKRHAQFTPPPQQQKALLPQPEPEREPPAPRVTVVDSLMGSGKTTAAIEMMRKMCEEVDNDWANAPRFVYLTPFLDEITRVKNELPYYEWLLKDPKQFHMVTDDDGMTPVGVASRKLDDFGRKLAEGKCIITTHQLFAL